jgi:hypothetical protein
LLLVQLVLVLVPGVVQLVLVRLLPPLQVAVVLELLVRELAPVLALLLCVPALLLALLRLRSRRRRVLLSVALLSLVLSSLPSQSPPWLQSRRHW